MGTLKLTQEQYVIDLLMWFNMTDYNPVLMPMEVGQLLSSLDCPDVLDKANVKEYQQLVGSLNYLVAWTSRTVAHSGSEAHSGICQGPWYARLGSRDPEGCSSVTGYCVMMNGSAILWESKRQKLQDHVPEDCDECNGIQADRTYSTGNHFWIH
eukprot:3085529-Rhodomonas_salina.1